MHNLRLKSHTKRHGLTRRRRSACLQPPPPALSASVSTASLLSRGLSSLSGGLRPSHLIRASIRINRRAGDLCQQLGLTPLGTTAASTGGGGGGGWGAAASLGGAEGVGLRGGRLAAGANAEPGGGGHRHRYDVEAATPPPRGWTKVERPLAETRGRGWIGNGPIGGERPRATLPLPRKPRSQSLYVQRSQGGVRPEKRQAQSRSPVGGRGYVTDSLLLTRFATVQNWGRRASREIVGEVDRGVVRHHGYGSGENTMRQSGFYRQESFLSTTDVDIHHRRSVMVPICQQGYPPASDDMLVAKPHGTQKIDQTTRFRQHYGLEEERIAHRRLWNASVEWESAHAGNRRTQSAGEKELARYSTKGAAKHAARGNLETTQTSSGSSDEPYWAALCKGEHRQGTHVRGLTPPLPLLHGPTYTAGAAFSFVSLENSTESPWNAPTATSISSPLFLSQGADGSLSVSSGAGENVATAPHIGSVSVSQKKQHSVTMSTQLPHMCGSREVFPSTVSSASVGDWVAKGKGALPVVSSRLASTDPGDGAAMALSRPRRASHPLGNVSTLSLIQKTSSSSLSMSSLVGDVDQAANAVCTMQGTAKKAAKNHRKARRGSQPTNKITARPARKDSCGGSRPTLRGGSPVKEGPLAWKSEKSLMPGLLAEKEESPVGYGPRPFAQKDRFHHYELSSSTGQRANRRTGTRLFMGSVRGTGARCVIRTCVVTAGMLQTLLGCLQKRLDELRERDTTGAAPLTSSCPPVPNSTMRSLSENVGEDPVSRNGVATEPGEEARGGSVRIGAWSALPTSLSRGFADLSRRDEASSEACPRPLRFQSPKGLLDSVTSNLSGRGFPPKHHTHGFSEREHLDIHFVPSHEDLLSCRNKEIKDSNTTERAHVHVSGEERPLMDDNAKHSTAPALGRREGGRNDATATAESSHLDLLSSNLQLKELVLDDSFARSVLHSLCAIFMPNLPCDEAAGVKVGDGASVLPGVPSHRDSNRPGRKGDCSEGGNAQASLPHGPPLVVRASDATALFLTLPTVGIEVQRLSPPEATEEFKKRQGSPGTVQKKNANASFPPTALAHPEGSTQQSSNTTGVDCYPVKKSAIPSATSKLSHSLRSRSDPRTSAPHGGGSGPVAASSASPGAMTSESDANTKQNPTPSEGGGVDKAVLLASCTPETPVLVLNLAFPYLSKGNLRDVWESYRESHRRWRRCEMDPVAQESVIRSVVWSVLQQLEVLHRTLGREHGSVKLTNVFSLQHAGEAMLHFSDEVDIAVETGMSAHAKQSDGMVNGRSKTTLAGERVSKITSGGSAGEVEKQCTRQTSGVTPPGSLHPAQEGANLPFGLLGRSEAGGADAMVSTPNSQFFTVGEGGGWRVAAQLPMQSRFPQINTHRREFVGVGMQETISDAPTTTAQTSVGEKDAEAAVPRLSWDYPVLILPDGEVNSFSKQPQSSTDRHELPNGGVVVGGNSSEPGRRLPSFHISDVLQPEKSSTWPSRSAATTTTAAAARGPPPPAVSPLSTNDLASSIMTAPKDTPLRDVKHVFRAVLLADDLYSRLPHALLRALAERVLCVPAEDGATLFSTALESNDGSTRPGPYDPRGLCDDIDVSALGLFALDTAELVPPPEWVEPEDRRPTERGVAKEEKEQSNEKEKAEKEAAAGGDPLPFRQVPSTHRPRAQKGGKGSSLAGDIWQLGMLAVEMADGGFPDWLAYQHVPSPSLRAPHWSCHFHFFVRRCFAVEAERRPSAAALLADPWFSAQLRWDARERRVWASHVATTTSHNRPALSPIREGGLSLERPPARPLMDTSLCFPSGSWLGLSPSFTTEHRRRDEDGKGVRSASRVGWGRRLGGEQPETVGGASFHQHPSLRSHSALCYETDQSLQEAFRLGVQGLAMGPPRFRGGTGALAARGGAGHAEFSDASFGRDREGVAQGRSHQVHTGSSSERDSSLPHSKSGPLGVSFLGFSPLGFEEETLRLAGGENDHSSCGIALGANELQLFPLAERGAYGWPAAAREPGTPPPPLVNRQPMASWAPMQSVFSRQTGRDPTAAAALVSRRKRGGAETDGMSPSRESSSSLPSHSMQQTTGRHNDTRMNSSHSNSVEDSCGLGVGSKRANSACCTPTDLRRQSSILKRRTSNVTTVQGRQSVSGTEEHVGESPDCATSTRRRSVDSKVEHSQRSQSHQESTRGRKPPPPPLKEIQKIAELTTPKSSSLSESFSHCIIPGNADLPSRSLPSLAGLFTVAMDRCAAEAAAVERFMQLFQPPQGARKDGDIDFGGEKDHARAHHYANMLSNLLQTLVSLDREFPPAASLLLTSLLQNLSWCPGLRELVLFPPELRSVLFLPEEEETLRGILNSNGAVEKPAIPLSPAITQAKGGEEGPGPVVSPSLPSLPSASDGSSATPKFSPPVAADFPCPSAFHHHEVLKWWAASALALAGEHTRPPKKDSWGRARRASHGHPHADSLFFGNDFNQKEKF